MALFFCVYFSRKFFRLRKRETLSSLSKKPAELFCKRALLIEPRNFLSLTPQIEARNFLLDVLRLKAISRNSSPFSYGPQSLHLPGGRWKS